MIKLCITLALLTASFTVASQVKVQNDTLKTNRVASHYEILQAVCEYHKLHLELKSPSKAYNRTYEVTINIKDLNRVLKVFEVGTGMKYQVKGDTLKVGWAASK